MTDTPKTDQIPEQDRLSRRRALGRLGLAVGVTTYIAPLLTNLSEASAQVCPPGQKLKMGTCV